MMTKVEKVKEAIKSMEELQLDLDKEDMKTLASWITKLTGKVYVIGYEDGKKE